MEFSLEWHNGGKDLMIKCTTNGCDLQAFFFGFGKKLCRVCYDRFLNQQKQAAKSDIGQKYLF